MYGKIAPFIFIYLTKLSSIVASIFQIIQINGENID